MEDITLRKDDQKKYITKIELNDDVKSFKIKYADGHEETKEFSSVHNYNVYIHQMKEQFYRYGNNYYDFLHKQIKESIIKGLIELVLAIEAIIITSRSMDPGVLQTAILILTVLFSLGYIGRKLIEISFAGNSIGYLKDVEEFINIQEKIKVPITDPVTGKEDEWYLGNLSDINYDSNIGLYKFYATCLEDEEAKEEESARIMSLLKGE